MIRVGFLGSDSTHTEAFGNLINGPESVFNKQARVVSIWGENPEQTARKAELLGISRCAQTLEEALKDVDLAMVIGRFGDSHYEPAHTAIDLGIPTFVDKPFTTSFEQARTLVEHVRRRNGRLFSSSPLRFAKELETLRRQETRAEFISVAAPANCIDLGDDPRFRSVFFYGIHAIEVLLELMGHDVSKTTIAPGSRALTIQLDLSSGTGAAQFVRDVDEFYEVRAYGRSGIQQFTIALDGSYYPRLLGFLFDQFYSGGQTIPLESTLKAIELLERAEQQDRGAQS